MNSKPTETVLTFPVSVEFIKAAVRDRLNTFKKIDDNTETINDMKFGEVTLDNDGNEVVLLSLSRTVYLGGAHKKEYATTP